MNKQVNHCSETANNTITSQRIKISQDTIRFEQRT